MEMTKKELDSSLTGSTAEIVNPKTNNSLTTTSEFRLQQRGKQSRIRG
jgi:hypothetical protein